MKFAIFGFALAFSLGASAQTASTGTADGNSGIAGGGAQAASPGSADSSPATTAGTAQAAGAPESDTATTSAAQTAAPDAAGANAAQATGVAQAAGPSAGSAGVTQTANPGPAEGSTASTGGGAQTAGPNAIDLHAGTTAKAADTAGPIALELHAGSSGAGAQAEFIFNDYITARVSGDWLRVSASFNAVDLNTIDIAYSGTANWTTVGAFLDVHPFRNGWFVSGGAFQGARNASFAGAPTGDVVIDGITFTPADIGTVMGEANLPSTSPFVGLGWDEAQHDRSGVTFRFMGGAAFGAPKVHLWDVGPYSDTPQIQEWLATEEAQAQSDADPWKAYPVVQVGIGYRF